ncbi:Uncharacterised protein [Raoultella planticola]|uniref:Uncharacterized protein n=1 Tax=Raoultella planticola TaxID=575 RepID=A0A485CLF1_RAOPL|nr:Uncharacterised protein [Raoultella planticola]
MNDQRRFSNVAEPRHCATLAIVVQRIRKSVNPGSDHIVKLADAAHTFELAQINR